MPMLMATRKTRCVHGATRRVLFSRTFLPLQDLSAIRKKLSYDAVVATVLDDSDDMGGPEEEDDECEPMELVEERDDYEVEAAQLAELDVVSEQLVTERVVGSTIEIGVNEQPVDNVTIITVATATTAATHTVPYVSPHLNDARSRLSLAAMPPSQLTDAAVPDARALLDRAMRQSEAGRQARCVCVCVLV